MLSNKHQCQLQYLRRCPVEVCRNKPWGSTLETIYCSFTCSGTISPHPQLLAQAKHPPKTLFLKEESVLSKIRGEAGSSDEGEIGLKAIKKKATQAFRSNHSCLGWSGETEQIIYLWSSCSPWAGVSAGEALREVGSRMLLGILLRFSWPGSQESWTQFMSGASRRHQPSPRAGKARKSTITQVSAETEHTESPWHPVPCKLCRAFSKIPSKQQRSSTQSLLLLFSCGSAASL